MVTVATSASASAARSRDDRRSAPPATAGIRRTAASPPRPPSGRNRISRSPKIVAQAKEMVASRMTISARISWLETAERIEADDDGRSGETQDGAGKFQKRGRLVPRDAPGDEKGENRRRRGQHHGTGRRHILLRPGDQQKRDRRIDGLLLNANSFQALASVGIRMPRARKTASRNSAAISERAEMKVIGGIEPRPILVSG